MGILSHAGAIYPAASAAGLERLSVTLDRPRAQAQGSASISTLFSSPSPSPSPIPSLCVMSSSPAEAAGRALGDKYASLRLRDSSPMTPTRPRNTQGSTSSPAVAQSQSSNSAGNAMPIHSQRPRAKSDQHVRSFAGEGERQPLYPVLRYNMPENVDSGYFSGVTTSLPATPTPNGQLSPEPTTPQRAPPDSRGKNRSSQPNKRRRTSSTSTTPSPSRDVPVTPSPSHVHDGIVEWIQTDFSPPAKRGRRQKDSQQSDDTKGVNYIYKVELKDGTILYKIGITRGSSTARAERIQHSCRFVKFDIRCDQEHVPLVHFERVEKLAQKELAPFLHTFDCRCEVGLREYFKVSEERATQSLQRWRRFCLRRPWDEDGRLKTFWRRRLENVPHRVDGEEYDHYEPRAKRWEAFVTASMWEVRYFDIYWLLNRLCRSKWHAMTLLYATLFAMYTLDTRFFRLASVSLALVVLGIMDHCADWAIQKRFFDFFWVWLEPKGWTVKLNAATPLIDQIENKGLVGRVRKLLRGLYSGFHGKKRPLEQQGSTHQPPPSGDKQSCSTPRNLSSDESSRQMQMVQPEFLITRSEYEWSPRSL